jgi:HD-like signal output (HDOD) protein
MQKAKSEFKPFDATKWNMEKLNEVLLPLVFDEYHAIVGALVAAKWKLPNSICEIVRFHHDYEKATDARTLACIVHTANLFCHHFGYGHEAAPVELHAQKSLAALKFNSDGIKKLVDEIPTVATSLMGNM